MIVMSNIDSTQQSVLTYLKKLKFQNLTYYDIIILFGVKPNDIIKYIERPEQCGKWPFDFVSQIYDAILKIEKYCLIGIPQIELQTDEDKVISKLLRKNFYLCFGTNTFFGDEIQVHHVIAFMERNEVIYEWNADFILKTQKEVKRVKEFLL